MHRYLHKALQNVLHFIKEETMALLPLLELDNNPLGFSQSYFFCPFYGVLTVTEPKADVPDIPCG